MYPAYTIMPLDCKSLKRCQKGKTSPVSKIGEVFIDTAFVNQFGLAVGAR